MTKKNDAARSRFDAATAAHTAARAAERTAQDALTAAEKEREPGRSLSPSYDYALVVARITTIEAAAELAASATELKRAGGGLPEERDPRSWNLAALVSEIGPIAEAIVDAEARIDELKKQAAGVIAAAKLERDAAAATRLAPDPLGPVPRLAVNLPAVLVSVERGRRTGRFDPKKIATAAGWVSSSTQAPEVPADLADEELVDAAIAGFAPRAPATRQLDSLRRQRDDLERAAAEAARAAEKERAEVEAREEARRARAADEERVRQQEAAERLAKYAAESQAAEKLREEGRAAMTGRA